MKIIILAGGSGTRLWPLSRKNYPKQFLKLHGDKSLLVNTAERFLHAVKPEDIIVITNKDHEFLVRSQLEWLQHIILEPVGRNTAPAIALAAKYCLEKVGSGEDEVMFISPADHMIEPVDEFTDYLRLSEQIAQMGHIVTFGIKPVKPETGYGYIKINPREPLAGAPRAYRVEQFVEKPDLETAKEYLADGSYYWNSGMFAFTIKAIKEELLRFAPDIGKMANLGFEEMKGSFGNMPSISVDHAVMERSRNLTVVPMGLAWNDIGSWDSMFDVSFPDGNKEKADDKVILMDSPNTIVIGNDRIIVTLGLEDCIVVDTDDALLIAKKGSGQKVKNVMENLVSAGRKEALEHSTIQKPWGSFTTLHEEKGFKVKKISINPGAKLSLQLHKHRAEHWIVVKGRAKITVDGIVDLYKENDSVYIPVSARHRAENCESTLLEIIEVQCGEYLGEDDIARIEDIYGRVNIEH